jgi:TetR/AcrR family transcriptional repressor of mexJK operon
MAAPSTKILREGSAQKRAAILTAARELFLADGFDRISVDAIAARAEVSKRTVYDYFGDKRTVLLAVVSEAWAALSAQIDKAIEHNLDAHFDGIDDLEAALVAFSRDIAVSALGSADYSALIRLISMEAEHIPELSDVVGGSEPEELIAERFAEFHRAGLLDAPDARLAVEHFVALTFSSTYDNSRFGRRSDDEYTDRMITEGVRAFVRAYAVR